MMGCVLHSKLKAAALGRTERMAWYGAESGDAYVEEGSVRERGFGREKEADLTSVSVNAITK